MKFYNNLFIVVSGLLVLYFTLYPDIVLSVYIPPVGNGQYYVQYRVIGHVYLDTNENGEFDDGEHLIDGLEVFLTKSDKQIAHFRTMYGEESFIIPALREAQYCITIKDSTLHKFSPVLSSNNMLYPNGSYCFDLNPQTTTNERGRVFRYFAGFKENKYPVSVITWHDVNQNGLIDEDEPYLPGISGEIRYDNENGPLYARFNTGELQYGHGFNIELVADRVYCIILKDPSDTYKIEKKIGYSKFDPITQSIRFYMNRYRDPLHIPAGFILKI
ncbi:hypothetical protein PPL_05539 [Heterostelium album PN500]|uniref:SD-repeat containing protein B domain-containing protein n=1 Tax=Heterostelium pallidum (strain ATCC 26659 / Pp 5 / PN500) TaxID=670386 RepID=D3BAG3_HETP5|nr:hypothetical protein PPL_05539 [Heterostelium album PN500]EFA81550.1 hypothetical protein PPL_05539 [Heterostelium album PN500]|eukprot:XP_020433667.1 hypothetical protein PPL_05539 [Heterostelium album PN500]